MNNKQYKTNEIWITSDNHFNHKNIVKFTGRPENHDYVMVANYNALVGNDDICYNLGDFCFAKYETQKEYAEKLNGTKVLIRGNHDGTISRMESLGFIVPERYLGKEHPFFLHYGNVVFVMTHMPMKLSILNEWSKDFSDNTTIINIHGHVHQNSIQSEIVEERDEVYIDTSWVWARKNLYYYNVSVEVTDLKPVRIDTITAKLKEAVTEGKKNGILN